MVVLTKAFSPWKVQAVEIFPRLSLIDHAVVLRGWSIRCAVVFKYIFKYTSLGTNVYTPTEMFPQAPELLLVNGFA